MAESRNRNDDERLKESYGRFYKLGSNQLKSRYLLNRLSSKELKLQKKSANVNGLQITDLIASPSFRSMLCEKSREAMTATFGKKVATILENGKYDTGPNGDVWGSGKKWLPK